jgi:hypothetical protein
VEATFVRTGLGGVPAAHDADRTFHVAVENRNATKLDYYVGVSVRQRVLLTKLGTAIIRTTVTVDDRAPRGAKPSYMLGPDGYATTHPGEYWAWVLLWGPADSTQFGSVDTSGLRLTPATLDTILAGEQRQVSFDTIIPNAVRHGELLLRYVPQPRLEAAHLDVQLDAPGWEVGGPSRSWSGTWDRIVTLRWRIGHSGR